MKDYDKNKEPPYLKYWNVNDLYISQKLPINNLNGLKIFLNLMKILEKAIMIKVMKDNFLNLMFNIPKIYITSTMIYSFCLKE